MKTRIWDFVCTLCMIPLCLDLSFCTNNGSLSHEECLELSDVEMAFDKCQDYCTENGGLLFIANHLAYNHSTFQSLLKNNTRFWIHQKDGECLVMNLDKDETIKVSCTNKESCNCYYENASVCSNIVSAVHILATKIIETTDVYIDNDTAKTAPRKHTLTIIISVYAASVLFIIIGGIAVIKIKQRRTQPLETLNEEDYEYFYPPFDVRARPPLLYSRSHPPHDDNDHSQIMFPGFPPLANIQEAPEASAPSRSTPPLPIMCGPGSMDSPERTSGGTCRPPPGLYTPLLNPVENSRSLTIQSDDTLMELVENPVYGGYCETTRL